MLVVKLYDLLMSGYDKLEIGLLKWGVSSMATDYLMIASGFIILGILLIAAIATIITCGTLLTASYIRMIKSKDVRVRRKWSIIFILTLILVIVDLLLIFVF